MIWTTFAAVSEGDPFVLAETLFRRVRRGMAMRLDPDGKPTGCVSPIRPDTPVRVLA